MYESNNATPAAVPNNNKNPDAEEVLTIESESSSFTEEDEEAPPPGYARYEDSLEDLLGDNDMYDDRGSGFGMCLQSKYGTPELNAKRAAELLPPGEEGMVWHARLVKTLRDVPKKDLDEVNQCIKPRRASLMVLADDFFSSLIKTDEKQPRWLFSGVLNGWPSLVLLEVQSITVSIKGTIVPSMKRGIAPVTRRTWSYKKEGLKGIAPNFPEAKLGIIRHEQVRVRLRAPGWTSKGWSKNSPGYAWWFEANREKPRLLHGLDMIRIPQKEIGETVDPICTHVHMFSHRYAVGGRKMENPKERFTYHSAILLEWDHQKYVTVVELALLNGLSGYSGKSNWYDDKVCLVVLACTHPPFILLYSVHYFIFARTPILHCFTKLFLGVWSPLGLGLLEKFDVSMWKPRHLRNFKNMYINIRGMNIGVYLDSESLKLHINQL